MRNADILVKLNPILIKMNSKQKTIAMQILSSSEYYFIDYNGVISIKTKEGLYDFMDFVKSKCNCN